MSRAPFAKTFYSSTANIDSLARLFLSSKLVRDAGKVLMLQFLARIVAFFASAYGMRALGPEQLGTGAFVLSIVAQGTVLGDLGLNIAGVRSLGNHPDKRDEIVSLVWGIRLRVAIVLAVLMLGGAWIFRPVGNMVIWFLAIPLLILSILSPQWIFQGLERVPVFNSIQLIQTIITAGLYFALFRPGVQAELYVAVALVTQLIGWVTSYFALRRYLNIRWRGFRWHEAWPMIRASGYAFAIVLTMFVYTGLEIPLITLLLSPGEAGVYRAAQSIVGVISPILSTLPLLVYPRLIVWANHSKEVFVKKSVVLIMLLGLLGLSLSMSSFIFVPVAFRMLLGPAFEAGILPCTLLFFAKGIVLVGAVPAWGLLAYKRDSQQFFVALAAASVSVASNLLLIPRFGVVAAASVSILSELIIFALSTILLFSFVGLVGDRSRLDRGNILK